jgi:hypothetical protein
MAPLRKATPFVSGLAFQGGAGLLGQDGRARGRVIQQADHQHVRALRGLRGAGRNACAGVH